MVGHLTTRFVGRAGDYHSVLSESPIQNVAEFLKNCRQKTQADASGLIPSKQ